MIKKVCIIGLGYVGLPLACLAARKGYSVTGLEINTKNVELLRAGTCHIKDEFLQKEVQELQGILQVTDDPSTALPSADIIIICVPTPVDHKFLPNLEYVESAGRSIAQHLRPGQIIVLESTVNPGTTEETLQPILEQSSLQAGKDFHLVHCPERIDPGNKKWGLHNIPRVLGSSTPEGATAAKQFYASIVNADILILKGLKEAEATKIMENSFRDVNIAFMNEMAKSFDKAGIDVTEVIRGASTKPFAFLPHYPGCGVGGHCIPVDPYYLIEGAKKFHFEHKFLELARKINKSMPEYTVSLLAEELNKMGKSVKGSLIGLYGVAYKKDVDDARESPSLEIMRLLQEKGATLFVYDPHAKHKNNVTDFEEFLKHADYLLIATNHAEFTNLELEKLKENNIKIIVDGRNCLDKEKIQSLGIAYKGIGR
ncbi:MAG TPA: nucleotide sugar dehydrogenase [Candidatus Nanoarchaeia archaeon]|nr:nucleotide sugar dehydrogenase [Candidatus Nanoarchaeia archaeon]